ncbi:MAG TPA: Smr/MutS family protein, partial [Ferruginibacter sp.]|nr:Smr/MutS family protein [Ferruginibacter sp.]
FPYFKMFSQKKQVEKKKVFIDEVKKEKEPKKKVKDGVFLSFIPVFDKDVFDDEVVERLKIYLVNQNEEAYNFSYNLLFAGEHNFQLKNSIGPLTEFYLHDVSFEDISDNPKFEFEFSLLNPDKMKAPYFEASVKLKGKQLFKKIEELQEKNDASFGYELFSIYPAKTEEQKVDLTGLGNNGFRIYDALKGKENLAPARSVIDLHLEKLTADREHLSNHEILTLQLNTFEKYFELAVLHHQASLIVIHGVGEGRLRDEIHEILRLKNEVKSFVNQFHPLYGYGATEIFFK